MATPADLGLSPSNSAAANAAALQAAIDAAAADLVVDFRSAPGVYPVNTVSVPCTKSVTLDLGFCATLAATGQPVLRAVYPDAAGGSDWEFKQLAVRNGRLSATGGHACLATDNTKTRDPRWHVLLLENVWFSTAPASAALPGYAIDLVADYSITPAVVRCQNKFGPLLRWRPGRLEYHATSALVIDQCRLGVAPDNRYAPDVWLTGHRNTEIRNTIIEGNWGYAAGVDAVNLYDGATGLLLEDPGPQLTRVGQAWFEHQLTRPAGHYEWVVRNTLSGGGGAYQPRVVTLEGVGGYGLVKNKADSTDAWTVYVEKSPGATVATSGLVDVIQRDAHALWQQDGPEVESGNQYESPALPGRREAGAEPLYVYPGGTGNDGSLARAGAVCYPHRHPTYGACLAVRGDGTAFTLPAHRRSSARRVHTRIRAASPHHVRQGGGAGGLWVRLAGCGTDIFRVVPDGFAPADLYHSAPGVNGASGLLAVGTWFSAPSGGTVYTPASPWLLVYGLSVAYGRPHPLAWLHGPCVSHEWSAGGGPPPGTYEFGDRVLTLNGGLPHLCDQPGTSRPIAVTATRTAGSAVLTAVSAPATILEGDYVTFPGVPRARVLAVAANGDLTLDTAAGSTAAGTAVANKPPSFARRRV